MKVSYNWLKQYLDFKDDHESIAEKLTSLGLEVEGMSKFESIPGGLRGVVIGKTISIKKHPNADRLKIVDVNVGQSENLQIICGAPNVDKNQTVAVALTGTTLYPENKKLKIKKSKIRGEISEGMICGQDELNLGEPDDGILIIDDKYDEGTPLELIYPCETDWIYDIGLTPNRSDALSHLGTARDLRARLNYEGDNLDLKTPSVSSFIIDKRTKNIKLSVEDESLVNRYCGIIMDNIVVKDSPDWLKNKLKSIGITPKNNIVDVTNYVMHDVGQPLHAFDYEKIDGNAIVVRKNNKISDFTTLDDDKKKLINDDLVICDSKKPMCIAGIYGGKESGVSDITTTIFIESAYFSPISIRKTSKRLGLSTDSSYRFERGIDPELTVYALKRAVTLIKEICPEALVACDLIDINSKKIEPQQIIISFEKIKKIIGETIEKDTIKKIISLLDIKINSITDSKLGLLVPSFRVDVKREADIIEEILRIYGYNKVKSSKKISYKLSNRDNNLKNKITERISNHLATIGFYEIITNSLTSISKNELNLDKTNINIDILNFSSNDLAQLRNSLIFSGLESLKYNKNHKTNDLKLFEIGKEYFRDKKNKIVENEKLALFVTGNKNVNNWNLNSIKSDFFYLKGVVKSIFDKIGLPITKNKFTENNNLIQGESILIDNINICSYGILNPEISKYFDINEEILYAEFDIDNIVERKFRKFKKFDKIAKYPEVYRDLSILIDSDVQFRKLHEQISKTNKNLIKDVALFDVFEGESIPVNKKSYGISIKIQDINKTLNEIEIDRVMQNIIQMLEKEFDAKLR